MVEPEIVEHDEEGNTELSWSRVGFAVQLYTGEEEKHVGTFAMVPHTRTFNTQLLPGGEQTVCSISLPLGSCQK